jgi:thiol-disulfide isomerase/thioredoxin
MKMRKLFLLPGLLLLCGVAVAKPLAPGTKSPDYLGETLAGQKVQVSALRGKVVVVSFWATWCKYCMEELPVLGNLQRVATQRHLPLQVVEVNFEQSHRVFVKATQLLHAKLPGLLITWDRYGALSDSFGLHDAGLPEMILLHRDGTIAHIEVGYDKSALDPLVARINQLMNEPAPPAAAGAPQSSAAVAQSNGHR